MRDQSAGAGCRGEPVGRRRPPPLPGGRGGIDKRAVGGPDMEGGAAAGLIDGVEDARDALGAAVPAVAELAGHGDGDGVVFGHARDEIAKGGGELVRVLPEGEGPAGGDAVYVGGLEIGP